jgi:LuxR family maltose regulon positive regulatory protein
MKKKVLIVDDHPLSRIGIRTILEANQKFKILGEAKDGNEAVSMALEKNPDIIIMDISMPQLSGIDATREILSNQAEAKVIALSIHSGEHYVKEMLDAGASGYMLKEEAPEDLINAVERVIRGDIYLSSSVTRAAVMKEESRMDLITYPVLRTKMLRPSILHSYLIRNRIIEELETNVGKPLSLISAGAGYGKSLAVSQWLEHTERLHAWISLDEEQNDLRVFLIYLVTAIEQVLPGSMNKTAKAVSGIELPPFRDLAYLLLRDLCEIEEEMILVLDDYHKIHEEKIHQLLDEWLRFPPPAAHLSIITRRDPPLKIKTMKLKGRITEIRMEKLSFTRDEIVELFKRELDMDLTQKAVQILYEKTEGWVIALRLASMIIDNAEDIKRVVDNIEGSNDTISDYLISEVLSRQPEKMQDPMLVSSILNRFSAEILDEMYLTDKEIDGEELIDFMKSANLFVIDLDVEKKWFRFHHLFQTLLSDQLDKKHKKEDINQYHLKASHWYEDYGFLEEAMVHALNANDTDRAIEIIKKHRLDLLNSNKYNQLELLQRKLPMSIIESHPELNIAESYIQWYHGNFPRLGELEEKMNQVIDRLGKDSQIHHEFLFFAGFNSLFLKGDLASALKYFDEAMKVVPESAAEPRGVLETHYFIFGQLGGVYEKLKQLYYNLIDRDLAPIRKNRIFQGFLAASMDQANMKELEANYLNAISYARDSDMKDALGIVLNISGSFLIKQGSWKNALKYYNEVLGIRYSVHSRNVIDCLIGLIITHCLMNDRNKAEETIKIMENYTLGLGDFFKIFMWSAKMRFHMIQGDHQAVRDLLPDYLPGVLDLVLWLDIPEITHARGLIFEGSKENLDQSESELAHLEGMTTALQNNLHLLEVKVLQAILFDKKGNRDKAEQALVCSLEISEPEGIILYYVELGEMFVSLIEQMPDQIKTNPFVYRILREIKSKSLKTVKEPQKIIKDKLNIITPRELEVLKCISEGLRNKEIADKLFTSQETVKKHIYNMFQKLDVKNRLSLVIKAREENILE